MRIGPVEPGATFFNFPVSYSDMNVQHLESEHRGCLYQHVLLEASNPVAAVAIVPNYMGIRPASMDLAREFVRPGVDVLILDVLGKERRPRNTDEAAILSEQLRADPWGLTGCVRAALEQYLATRTFGSERLSVVGFCFGGSVALELARTGWQLKGVVALHAGLSSSFEPGEIEHRSRVLSVQGAADPLVPPEQVLDFHREMNAQTVEWELVLLGGLYHGFTDPVADTPGIAKFDAKGRSFSFERARDFLA